MSDFDDLITTDSAWALRFRWALTQLDDNATGQLELWPVEYFLGENQYVACSRRRTHQALTECWMCWSDVTWGHANASEVLAPRLTEDEA